MGTRDLPTRRHAQVSRPALGEALLHVQIPSTSLKSATLGRRALPEWPSGVYGIPRREPTTESGMQVDAVLGGAKAINFQPTGGGKAAITGAFLVTGNEVTANQQHKAKEETMRPTHFVLVCVGLLTIVVSNAIAQEMRRGTVASIDEPGGSVTILQSPTGTVGSSGATRSGKFAVQDGLLFNALREGDKVMFTSQEIN